MDITAGMVKELRETTSAGMMDCKKALQETDGNMEEAVKLLREKGLAKAAKKAGRIASEGATTGAPLAAERGSGRLHRTTPACGTVSAVAWRRMGVAACAAAFCRALVCGHPHTIGRD